MSESLLAWFKEVGVWWSSDLIEYRGPGVAVGDDGEAGGAPAEGCGVFAKVDLKPGDVVARIPKSACLSASSSPIADILAAENLGGGLALTVRGFATTSFLLQRRERQRERARTTGCCLLFPFPFFLNPPSLVPRLT